MSESILETLRLMCSSGDFVVKILIDSPQEHWTKMDDIAEALRPFYAFFLHQALVDNFYQDQ